MFGLIKLDFPFLSGSDYITSCCIDLLLVGRFQIGLVANWLQTDPGQSVGGGRAGLFSLELLE